MQGRLEETSEPGDIQLSKQDRGEVKSMDYLKVETIAFFQSSIEDRQLFLKPLGLLWTTEL
ncbi:UNVERIFIED_CONTAM: hypothetical protein FKN15_005483 [Acipenser sinensis]